MLCGTRPSYVSRAAAFLALVIRKESRENLNNVA
jgi:hypothetical protein